MSVYVVVKIVQSLEYTDSVHYSPKLCQMLIDVRFSMNYNKQKVY